MQGNSNSELEFVVVYNNNKYDIGNYLDKHPGGKAILERYENKDITEKFNQIGHSNVAKNILETHFVQSDNSNNISLTTTSEKIDKELIYKKLFTKEDEYFIHKFLGILALLSFIYRYSLLITYGSFGFDNPSITILSLALHTLLSSSSFIFHVLERRIVSNPLLIYKEYRLHAILFTLRSVGISIIGLCNVKDKYTTVIFMLMIHILVDITTLLYGTKGVTSVRAFDKSNLTNRMFQLSFSFYQFVAIGCQLTNRSSIQDGFNTLIAIQSSAFLMTLRRKNLIKDWLYVFWYGVALILSMYAFMLTHSSILFAVIGILFYFRVRFNVNKYVIWTIFTILYHNVIKL